MKYSGCEVVAYAVASRRGYRGLVASMAEGTLGWQDDRSGCRPVQA
jgi:hypothetical protein